ncbi:MAG: hypothetical protein IPQ24_14300 [Anaeromyxobacter sp.]|nr:hypothetical protein [Anaeromyxobacter sp.]
MRVRRSQALSTARLSRVLLALALLTAQFGAAAHFAVARHAVCADHGEVIHPGEGAEPGHASATAPRAEGPALAEASDHGGHGHGHDHCGLASHRRAAVVEVGPSLPQRPEHAQRRDEAVPERAIASSGLYRRAPKQSPPA